MKYTIIQVNDGVAQVTHQEEDITTAIFDWDTIHEIATEEEAQAMERALDEGNVEGAITLLSLLLESAGV